MRKKKNEDTEEIREDSTAAGEGSEGVTGQDASNPESDLVAKLTEERDGLKDQLLRTMADFQNFRKRVQQEKQQDRLFAAEQIITQLLPVLDNFERAIAAYDLNKSGDSLVEGIRAIDRQIRSVLDSQQVHRISAKGSHFDPQFHEAIALEESTEHEPGVILHEVEAGYRMGEKVIRPARVKVATRS